MTVKRMDNVLIVVDDLEAVKAFFIELGLKLEGQTTVEGPSVGSLIGLKDVRATLAMLGLPMGRALNWTSSTRPRRSGFGRWTRRWTRWASVASCSPSMTSTLSLRACAPGGPSSLAKCSTTTRTGWPTSAGLKASLSRLPSSSAKVSGRCSAV
jgi:hypothetical protein